MAGEWDPVAILPLGAPSPGAFGETPKIAAPPEAGGSMSLGDALTQTAHGVRDWLHQDREQAIAEGLIDPATGWPTDKGWKHSASAAAFGLGTSDLGPIKAFHGSPHSFDRFSMDKIGTGEGAQAYGRGLYFAGNEGVARSYRDALSDPGVNLNFPGVYSGPIANAPADIGQLGGMLKYFGGDHDKLAQWATEFHPEWIETAQKMQASGANAAGNGHMYEVALHADPAKMLDWDKPLAAQAEVMSQLDRAPGAVAAVKYGEKDPTGGQFHNSLRSINKTPEATADALRSAGIPGIKYLDGGSRAAGEGSHNYVMFDPKLIEILRKYGVAGLGIGVGAAANGWAPVQQTDPWHPVEQTDHAQ